MGGTGEASEAGANNSIPAVVPGGQRAATWFCKPAFYVVPAELSERVRGAIEETEDVADLERFDRTDDGVRYPQAVALAITDGAHPLRAWRDHRALTLEQLARALKAPMGALVAVTDAAGG